MVKEKSRVGMEFEARVVKVKFRVVKAKLRVVKAKLRVVKEFEGSGGKIEGGEGIRGW